MKKEKTNPASCIRIRLRFLLCIGTPPPLHGFQFHYYHAPFLKIMTIRIREVSGVVTQRKRQQNCSCCLNLYKLVQSQRSNLGVEYIDPCE